MSAPALDEVDSGSRGQLQSPQSKKGLTTAEVHGDLHRQVAALEHEGIVGLMIGEEVKESSTVPRSLRLQGVEEGLRRVTANRSGVPGPSMCGSRSANRRAPVAPDVPHTLVSTSVMGMHLSLKVVIRAQCPGRRNR